jgi:hypothetical protein
VLRKAFPIHVDTMPSIQVNGLVITMPDFTARNGQSNCESSVAISHGWQGWCQPFKLCIADAPGMRTRNYHHLAEVSHQLLTTILSLHPVMGQQQLGSRTGSTRFLAVAL